MRPEVFVVLLVSLSRTVAEGNDNTSNPDTPISHINVEILGNTDEKFDNDDYHDDDDDNPINDYHYENYYVHIIDQSLERLKQNNQEYSIDASITLPETHRSEMPVEGTIKFDGMHSLRAGMTEVKQFENGDRDLMATFELGNISGIGIFSGLSNVKERKNYVFHFHPAPTDIQVFFMITKDPARKRVTFQFAKPPRYLIHETRKNRHLNVTLLLEQKASIVFNRLFNDLYNIIYERLILTPRIDSPHFDTILDNIFNKPRGNEKPIELSSSYSSNTSRTSNSSSREGMIFSTERVVQFVTAQNMSVNKMHSLTRMSKVQVIKEIDGGHDLQTTIKIGNISGKAFVVLGNTETAVEESCTFTSTPVVMEAFIYIKGNKSQSRSTYMYNVLEKPSYTIQLQNEILRNTIQLLLARNSLGQYYNHVFSRILEEIHAKFTKTN